MRFTWARWLRSISRPRGKTYQKRHPFPARVGLEALEDRTLPASLPGPVVSNQTALPTSFANPQANHPLFDAQIAINPLDPQRLVAVASYTPTNQSATDVPGVFVWNSTNGGGTWNGPTFV